jgi:prepilin-type N-terminal cleavage/methylation domain-containing protein
MMNQRIRGFTIVELLIVIVVIAILAAIVIVAYNGVQAKARDNRRYVDMQSIQKALEVYKTLNGNYPNYDSGNESPDGWESSYVTGTFIKALKTGGAITTTTPVDPINNSTSYYRYYRYNAGQYGCDATRGDYYVLQIKKLDATTAAAGPGFQCSGRNWAASGSWTSGSYVN